MGVPRRPRGLGPRRPALILLGAFDALAGTAGAGGIGFAGTVPALAAPYTPPAWSSGATAVRFLTAFAFLQTMHYVVWCGFVPRWGRAATAAFESRWEWARDLGGRRLVVLAGAVAVLLAVLLVSDWRTGRALYGSLASFHAYLEFPVVLALLAALSPGGRR